MIKFEPYKLEEHYKNHDDYVYLGFSKDGFRYVGKRYNGVAIPSRNLIMMLGAGCNLNVAKWAKTVHHETLHFILYDLGITDVEKNEELVKLLEGAKN